MTQSAQTAQLCGHAVGPRQPLFVIAGPDSLESETLCVDIAGHVKAIADRLDILYIFKGSFDKANRSSHASYRGPGIEQGLKMLDAVRAQVGMPVLTDVHEDTPLEEVATVVDVIQTPAFLCRQTNYMQRVARLGRPINVKKGQFMSPWEMANVIAKMRAVAPDGTFLLCERGFSFGYNNLVVDMRGLAVMRDYAPVVFDASHSVQLPGGQGQASGGQREFIPVLARAAVAAGVSGLFTETHPKPEQALCDGPNSLRLADIGPLLETLVELDATVKRGGLA
ncbi:MAG: 3-deoxy-8-phosphooctulonate synthase [Nevskiaceae bacterium]|nr:MAG: 3-deoxy-8-phosphooctulonate synthase [Nevskiaceae bacterium]TBR71774.1 MAG: 3-deoxy-8-phosphooctulonate synthase [Nevskiaceae bacterium]